MKTILWIGFRNFLSKQKVRIIVAMPITERIEAERSTKVKVRAWSCVRPIATDVTSAAEIR